MLLVGPGLPWTRVPAVPRASAAHQEPTYGEAGWLPPLSIHGDGHEVGRGL